MPKGKQGFQKGHSSFRTEESYKKAGEKISKSQKGKKAPWAEGQKNHLWKGEKAGYCSIHEWVRRKFGSPKKCEVCGTVSAKRYEWANKDHSYRRERNDYVRMCQSCHIKYDRENNNKLPKFEVSCVVCGKRFEAVSKRAIICSRHCRYVRTGK